MQRPTRDDDRDALLRLEGTGADPDEAQPLEFFLYFADEGEARSAGRRLAVEGFVIDLGRPDDTAWLVLARRNMVPRLPELRALRRRLEALAGAHGGTYDGWGVRGAVV